MSVPRFLFAMSMANVPNLEAIISDVEPLISNVKVAAPNLGAMAPPVEFVPSSTNAESDAPTVKAIASTVGARGQDLSTTPGKPVCQDILLVLSDSPQAADVADAPTVKKRANPSGSNPRASKKQKVYTSVPKSRKGVIAMIQSWGYENPENASLCAIAGLARGSLQVRKLLFCVWRRLIVLATTQVDFEAKLDGVAWKGHCGHCGQPTQVQLRALLDQPDSGHDYEEGSPHAAVVCNNENCGERDYLTSMCSKNPIVSSGKYHKHCTQCKGFGQCIGDYRESHCNDCGKHYFRGLTGFPCENCENSRERGCLMRRIHARGSRRRNFTWVEVNEENGCTIS
eukprot:768670-Hanusia_phi.AAC.6